MSKKFNRDSNSRKRFILRSWKKWINLVMSLLFFLMLILFHHISWVALSICNYVLFKIINLKAFSLIQCFYVTCCTNSWTNLFYQKPFFLLAVNTFKFRVWVLWAVQQVFYGYLSPFDTGFTVIQVLILGEPKKCILF